MSNVGRAFVVSENGVLSIQHRHSNYSNNKSESNKVLHVVIPKSSTDKMHKQTAKYRSCGRKVHSADSLSIQSYYDPNKANNFPVAVKRKSLNPLTFDIMTWSDY